MMILIDTANTAADDDDMTSQRHVRDDVTSPSNNNTCHDSDRSLASCESDVTDDVMAGVCDNNNAETVAAAAGSGSASTDEDEADDDDGPMILDDFINNTSSSSSSFPPPMSSFYHTEPAYDASLERPMSYRSSLKQHWGAKGDMVYSLLSILGTHNRDDMSRTLLAMSTSSDSCLAMRQSGCLPLLVHLIHDMDDTSLCIIDDERSIRARASAALHNIVMAAAASQHDLSTRHEARVLRLLEQLRCYCDQLRPASSDLQLFVPGPMELHPGPAIAALMKLSFDEQHRQAICALGGLQAIAELLQVDNEVTGNTQHLYNITMRRYACMALTNLTFADGVNKALLCSMLPALRALVAQLESPSEDLCQVSASVIRNLSWHSDLASKRALSEVEAAIALMKSVMIEYRRESTLKSLLSAEWNLSSHGADNKADICSVPGALDFLVNLLSYRSPSKTLSVIENAGGILRNVSSHIAVRDDYRAVLRRAGCLQTLLRHLRSPSLTVVSNACGTLWNLSARCAEDQSTLLQLGAVAMLKNLVHSRHRMISMGSAAALKNLLTAAADLPSDKSTLLELDSQLTRSDSSQSVGLHIRRQRALEQDLNRRQLSETCEDIDSPVTSPTNTLRSAADVPHRRIQSTSPLKSSAMPMSMPPCHRSSSWVDSPAVDMPMESPLTSPNSLLRSAGDGRSDSSSNHRRIQSPSPLRSSLVSRRSSSHAGVPASHSSDELSAWDRGRILQGRVRRPSGWWSRDSGGQVEPGQSVEMTSGSVYQSSMSSPSASSLANDQLHTGLGSRRFLKSKTKPVTEPSAAMYASFLSERTENIHLEDLELKSSFDLDELRRYDSRYSGQTARQDSHSDGQKSTNNLTDVAIELRQTRPETLLSYEDKTNTNMSAAADDDDDKEVIDDKTGKNISDSKTISVPDSDAIRRLDELIQLLPRTIDCTLFTDDADIVTDSVNNQHCPVASEQTETSPSTTTECVNLTDSALPSNDNVLTINFSTHSETVSDIMDESFPNLTQSTNSDLQSSTDLLTGDQLLPALTSLSSDKTAVVDTSKKEEVDCVADDSLMFAADSDDMLCCNSDELLSLLEENANRVLRELELKTADSTSSGEIRLLEDETISLVSGHNDNDLDDDDDEYIDAISSRTYDISSASGEAACLSSRHSSPSSAGSGSRQPSPPETPVKLVTPGRPRIVKPSDNVDQSTDVEVKGIRGRRKALYSVTRPKIPPASQSTGRPSSAVKSRPVEVSAAKRPNSAGGTSSSKPAMVRPATNRSTTVNNKASDSSSPRRALSTTTSRVKQTGPSAAAKKLAAQSTVADNKVKRPDVRTRSTSSTSRPSSASQPVNNERPTPPIKQATFTKSDQSVEDTNNAGEQLQVQTEAETSIKSVQSVSKDGIRRPSSASSVRSNKPAVSVKPPVRGSGTTSAAGRLKVSVRPSSPSSTRTDNSTTRAGSATARSSTARTTRSGNASSPVTGARKPISQSQSSAATSKKPVERALTRTSTYDKLDDADKLETVVCSEPLPPTVIQQSSEPAVSSASLTDVVIRRSRQLVEQADQIHTRRVSPPQSIRFSASIQPVDDVIQRPSDRQLDAVPQVNDSTRVEPCMDEQTTSRTQCSQPSQSADKSKPSPVRKFGFMGLWRRQRSSDPQASTEKREETSSEAGSPRRRTFSWWRRQPKTTDTERATSGGLGRGSVTRPRSPTCRAAIVTPFNYRPSQPTMYADLPESHQTKTAMLIERRMRRLKMASESSCEQTTESPSKSKPDLTPRRKNLLVTTV